MNQQQPQPVEVKGKTQIVYAIPAKPKPRRPWWQESALELLVIWGCVVLGVYIWLNP
jgi:hypothetical protein